MILFIITDHCQSRTKCHICRSPESHGVQFRSILSTVHEMPGPGLFACPFGVTAETAVRPPLPPPVRRSILLRVRVFFFRFIAWALVHAFKFRAFRWAVKRQSDRGAGDTIHRLIPWSAAIPIIYKRMTGKDCGCGDIVKKLNEEFPYGRGQPPPTPNN